MIKLKKRDYIFKLAEELGVPEERKFEFTFDLIAVQRDYSKDKKFLDKLKKHNGNLIYPGDELVVSPEMIEKYGIG